MFDELLLDRLEEELDGPVDEDGEEEERAVAQQLLGLSDVDTTFTLPNLIETLALLRGGSFNFDFMTVLEVWYRGTFEGIQLVGTSSID